MRLLALTAAALLTAPALAGPIYDPAGDPSGVPVAGLDIVNSPGFVPGGGNFVLTVNFAGPISAPSLGAPNSVAALIDLDLDRNPLTGAAPWTSTYVPGPLNLGSEAYISLFDDIFTPGFAGLYRTSDNALLASLPVTFGPTSFSLTLPASAIGGISEFNYALVSIPLAGDGFDRAPNGATPFNVPEPASMAVAGLFATAALAAVRRRRAAVVAG